MAGAQLGVRGRCDAVWHQRDRRRWATELSKDLGDLGSWETQNLFGTVVWS